MAFKDLFFSVPQKKVKPTGIAGEPGTVIIGGQIQEDEKNYKLHGSQKYKLYSDILSNVSVVSAGTRYFLNLVSKAKWTVEPADESSEAKDIAEKIDHIINNMATPWHRVVRRAAMYRFYGFSIQEWIAEKDKETGIIGFFDVSPRPQVTIDKWERDEHGCVVGIVQLSPTSYEELYMDRGKLVYLVDDTLNDSPEGLGLFRHLVEPVKRLRSYERLEATGFETDLRGIPIGRAPFGELSEQVQNGTITEADKLKILAPLKDFITNHIKTTQLGMILDSVTWESSDESQKASNVNQWGVDLLKGGNTSQQEVAAAIQRITQDIARILGIEGLLLGGSSVSSNRSLADDKSQNLAITVDGTNKEIASVFGNDLLNPLMEMNGWNIKLKPTLKPEAVRFRNIQEMSAVLHDLASAGAPLDPDDPVINEFRELLNLSDAIPFKEEGLALDGKPKKTGEDNLDDIFQGKES
jgi:hypothetical protein